MLIVSAQNSLEDKITGMELGADDYLLKPFHLSELAVRIKAIILRKNAGGDNRIEINELVIDTLARTAIVNKQVIDITKKEYQMFLYFAYNSNRVMSKNAISEHLWEEEMEGAANYDLIYTHVKNLRRKLLAAGCEDYIKSVYGMGYKFSV